MSTKIEASNHEEAIARLESLNSQDASAKTEIEQKIKKRDASKVSSVAIRVYDLSVKKDKKILEARSNLLRSYMCVQLDENKFEVHHKTNLSSLECYDILLSKLTNQLFEDNAELLNESMKTQYATLKSTDFKRRTYTFKELHNMCNTFGSSYGDNIRRAMCKLHSQKIVERSTIDDTEKQSCKYQYEFFCSFITDNVIKELKKAL